MIGRIGRGDEGDPSLYEENYQSIFTAGLVLFIGGILVRNYWKGRQGDERYDPTGMWSNTGRVTQEKQFDLTGVGCALMVLGPGIFLIVGFLRRPQKECLIFCCSSFQKRAIE